MNRPILTRSLGPKSSRATVERWSETRLFAQTSPRRLHPWRARWRMEAGALLEGVKVRAVICADNVAGSFVRAFWDAVAMDLSCPEYASFRRHRYANEESKRRLMHDCVSRLGGCFEGCVR